MSAATEQNNGDVAVEKVAAAADIVDAAAVKEDLKSAKPAVEEKSATKADNGTKKSKENDVADDEDGDSNARSPGDGDESNADSNLSPPAAARGTKRPTDHFTAVADKKAKKDKAEAEDDEDDDGEEEEEVLEEITEGSEVESDEYDIPYDEDIECEDDDDDENDDGSDDQA